MKEKIYRWLIYCIGMIVLAAGISLNTKTGLGTSPIISVSYFASVYTGYNFGNMTFILYIILIILQFCLRGKNSHWYDILQLPLSLVFSQILNLFGLIPYESSEHGIIANLALLALAIILTGVGVSMTINMRLIPNPGDGIVQALSERMKWKQGFTKNVVDISCTCITTVFSLLLVHKVVGVHIGTICAMLGTGRVVAVTNRLFRRRMCAAAGFHDDTEA